ncbi:hypothetical protein B0H17DRAFT_864928, partial [Mycena rosella]
VSETSKHLSFLDSEIWGLRERLKQLEEECVAVSICHAQNSIILSPLRRMPPKVLGEIFSWILPSARDPLDHDIGRSPWVLTHISSRWRAVALLTPLLWSLVV